MQYVRNPGLESDELEADPLLQFERWLGEAGSAGLVEPTAMALATVDAAGRPSLRMVLFKGLVGDGFSFYTNYESRKGRELDARPVAALTFWWDRQERQIRIEGRVERVPDAFSEQYFHARPRGSQLGAYASRQSQVIDDRAILESRVAALSRSLEGAEVPRPDYWGGYRVIPQTIEFWQGRLDRLHDRFVYERNGDAWTKVRLEP